jgi:hypothetical protein
MNELEKFSFKMANDAYKRLTERPVGSDWCPQCDGYGFVWSDGEKALVENPISGFDQWFSEHMKPAGQFGYSIHDLRNAWNAGEHENRPHKS